jgi:hypothetical protein
MINRRKSFGGTATDNVLSAIAEAEKELRALVKNNAG